MAKKGKCVNIDCDHYKEEIDIQAGEEFECPYCHKPLAEVEGKGKDSKKKKKDDGNGLNWKLIGGIAAAVLVLGGLGYGGYALYDSHQKSEQEKAELQAKAEQQAEELRNKQREDSLRAVQEAEDAAATAEEEARRADIVAQAQQKADSIIEANEKLLDEKAKKIRDDAKTVINAQLTSLRTASQTLQYENIALIDTMEVAINEAWKNADKPASTGGGSGKVNLGYGTYEGPTKGGQAHGVGGTIKFTRSYSIDLKKASGETVEVSAGDVLYNVKMENGRLIQGQLKRADGSQRWIIIG